MVIVNRLGREGEGHTSMVDCGYCEPAEGEGEGHTSMVDCGYCEPAGEGR